MLDWSIVGAKCSSIESHLQNASSIISSLPSNVQKRKLVRSRSLERQKKLNGVAFAPGQTRITEYFTILNQVEYLMKTNHILQQTIINMKSNTQFSPIAALIDTQPDSLMKILLKSAIQHTSKNKFGYRHDETVKMFASYLRMIGGRLMYETLHANLPLSLPSIPTVDRYIADTRPPMIEGVLRVDELLQYLKQRNLPLVVFISEDGTRTIGKVNYDSTSNKLVGFSLPLNENGMPITNSFTSRKSSHILSMKKTQFPPSPIL